MSAFSKAPAVIKVWVVSAISGVALGAIEPWSSIAGAIGLGLVALCTLPLVFLAFFVLFAPDHWVEAFEGAMERRGIW